MFYIHSIFTVLVFNSYGSFIIRPRAKYDFRLAAIFKFYEGWNFNSGSYLFTTDTK